MISAFYRGIEQAALKQEARVVLIDVGPNPDAINRATILSAQYVVVPLAPDLILAAGFAKPGAYLTLLAGGMVGANHEERRNRTTSFPYQRLRMEPIGYIVMQHATRRDRPVQAYGRWMARIPEVYRESVLEQFCENPLLVDEDPLCLYTLKHYHSLMLMAMEARKPIFLLKPADGAIGSHAHTAQICYQDFKALALKIADRAGIKIDG